MPEGTLPLYETGRTAERQRTEVRQRVGTKYKQSQARQIAEATIRKEVTAKNRPADLINIALEKVVAAGLELPTFSTFDTMASTIRTEVNTSICWGIHNRMSLAEQARMLWLLEERDSDGITQFNRLKQTAQGPSWSHCKRLFTHLQWLDELGDTAVWVDGVAAPKVTDFARGGRCGRRLRALGEDGKTVDIAFSTQNWRKAVLDETRPGRFVRKRFEAMVLTHLAEELRTGDVAVVGSEEYASWSEQLLAWEGIQEKPADCLVEVGLCEESEAGAFDATSFRR
ncbi:hypothetical protein ACIO3R_10010 [Streptomyces sp. NPDC087428]|uniref:hypothetical protein n=1 Tax=Streptomyces sp. NPDC087428 TaxID=3365788 RepID=UPI00382B338B